MIEYLERRSDSARDPVGPWFSWEVLVVDDGSTDGTSALAMRYASRLGYDRVRVMRLPRNSGKGFAIKSGVLAARGEAVLMADADGATEVRRGLLWFAPISAMTASRQQGRESTRCDVTS